MTHSQSHLANSDTLPEMDNLMRTFNIANKLTSYSQVAHLPQCGTRRLLDWQDLESWQNLTYSIVYTERH